jgi:ParB family transcriptional regulator, chromosome partitioning protein
MAMQLSNSNAVQLELLDVEPGALPDANVPEDHRPARQVSSSPATRSSARTAKRGDGCPLVVALAQLYEDPKNPRTEFPEPEIEELADDIRQHGILQAIVVHPADAAGRYRIHFGAKRLRAARRAGLVEVPVVVRDAPADAYAQVAENQKRHGLTPLDLARFIRAKVNEGESNAAIAARLGMDPTTVGHHLALLEIPPELDDALKSGRCTSPRSLYELSKLHEARPDRVKALVTGESEITRAAIAAVRAEQGPVTDEYRPRRCAASLLAQAHSACARLELALTRIKQVEQDLVEADLASLRQRLVNLASRVA